MPVPRSALLPTGMEVAPHPYMESHPAVRRHPRVARHNHPQVTLPGRAPGTLILVTDDPDFPIPHVEPQTRVWRWTSESTGSKPQQFGGDPAAAATYAWTRELEDLCAIVALPGKEENDAAAAAIRQAHPWAGLLVVGAARPARVDQPLIRHVDPRTALKQGLEHEWKRLATLKRVQALRRFADPVPVLPILIHQDPDPDGLASALALRALLQRSAHDAPVVTLDEMTRPENRRMAELLDIQVTQVTPAELLGFEHILCADMQPRDALVRASRAAHRQTNRRQRPRLAIIDHHPYEPGMKAEFLDIRADYGAAATIVTEYLRAREASGLPVELATGLAYAIKIDTDNLSRGVSAADIDAYTYLLEHIDAELLRRLERPALSAETARAYGLALSQLRLHQDLVLAFLGAVTTDASHILSDLADFCLSIDVATWAAAAALVEGRLVIALRHFGAEPGAGVLARALAAGHGTGGGHETMARVVLLLEDDWSFLKDASMSEAADWLLERLVTQLDVLRAE